jgi:hypothetical protein
MPADPNMPKLRAFPSLKWSENRLFLLVQNAPFVKGKMSGKMGKSVPGHYLRKLLKFRLLQYDSPPHPRSSKRMQRGKAEGIPANAIIGIEAVTSWAQKALFGFDNRDKFLDSWDRSC